MHGESKYGKCTLKRKTPECMEYQYMEKQHWIVRHVMHGVSRIGKIHWIVKQKPGMHEVSTYGQMTLDCKTLDAWSITIINAIIGIICWCTLTMVTSCTQSCDLFVNVFITVAYTSYKT